MVKGDLLKMRWFCSSYAELCNPSEEFEHCKISIKGSYSLILGLILHMFQIYIPF